MVEYEKYYQKRHKIIIKLNYLPSKIGGKMDATLVIGTKIDPNEMDVEAHNIDTLFKYH